MKKRNVGFVVVVAAIAIIIASCSTTSQVSNIIMYDNSVLMAREFDILSQEAVRIEIEQVEHAARSAVTKSTHDRIMEKVKETYPSANDVLIISLEAVGKVTTTRSGSTEHFTYIANVFPIKFR